MFYSSIPKIQSLNGYEVFSVSPRHHIKQSCEVRVYTGACVGLIHGHRANPHPWGLGETYPYKTAVSVWLAVPMLINHAETKRQRPKPICFLIRGHPKTVVGTQYFQNRKKIFVTLTLTGEREQSAIIDGLQGQDSALSRFPAAQRGHKRLTGVLLLSTPFCCYTHTYAKYSGVGILVSWCWYDFGSKRSKVKVARLGSG